MEVTITLGTGSYVRHDCEARWRPTTSTVRVDGVPRIVVTGSRSELVLSTGTVDVSADVPASIADDPADIVDWWSVEMQRQEAEAETVRMEAERDEVVQRLARKARAEGVQLYRDAKGGRHYASSVSNPGAVY